MIQLACVQMELNLADYRSETSFRLLIMNQMEKVRQACPRDLPTLVAFPEDVGTFCVFAGEYDSVRELVSLHSAINRMLLRHAFRVILTRLRKWTGWVRSLALIKAPEMAEIYIDTFSEAARKYGVYLVAGSTILPDLDESGGRYRALGRDAFNVSYLFGPDGRILGTQRKVNLIPLEDREALDIRRARLEDISAIQVDGLGSIGIAVCLDAFQPEVIGRLASIGADILVQPSANPGKWTPEQQEDWLNGSCRAVSTYSNFKYALNPMLVGSLFDLEFQGQSAIFARDPALASAGGYAAARAKGPGFVRVAASWNREEIISAVVP